MSGINVRRLRALPGAIATVVSVALAGCAAPTLSDMPLPAPSVSADSYILTARFANALNLPGKAKVRLAGADIGEVVSMSAQDYTAVVTMRVRSGVRLPKGSVAELRTATPLGDVFVAIKPPSQPEAEFLADGDTIELRSTASAATVEEVLSSAAVLVNGGVVRDMTKLVNSLGRAAGNNGDVFGELIDQSATLMGTLGDRSEQIQDSLETTTRLVNTLNSRQNTIDDLLESTAPALAAVDAGQLADTVDVAGDIATHLAKFPSLQGTDTRSTIADLNAVSRALNDVVLSPDTSLAAVNRLLPMLIRATSGTSIAVDVNIAKLALGNWPDIGYLGDPNFHGPKRADWQYLVGSLKYVLYRLQERVVGQKP
ncbi:MlaD family protein [Mycolicibacterium fortuitum]